MVSPIDGRIDVKDVSIGNYATAGQTTLATVSNIDKVRVKFSMSENEYLKLFARTQGIGAMAPGHKITITLSDGKEYPMQGEVEQVDSGPGPRNRYDDVEGLDTESAENAVARHVCPSSGCRRSP